MSLSDAIYVISDIGGHGDHTLPEKERNADDRRQRDADFAKAEIEAARVKFRQQIEANRDNTSTA